MVEWVILFRVVDVEARWLLLNEAAISEVCVRVECALSAAVTVTLYHQKDSAKLGSRC